MPTTSTRALARIKTLVFVSLFMVLFHPESVVFARGQDVILDTGKYQTESFACAYNINLFSDENEVGYDAEAADNGQIECGDAGETLYFKRVGMNRYRVDFDRAGVAYEWHIRSKTFFIENVLKQDPAGNWRLVRTVAYRLVHSIDE